MKFYSLSYCGEVNYSRSDGAFIEFFENGRIKMIRVSDCGITIYEKRFNKLGIRTYFYKRK